MTKWYVIKTANNKEKKCKEQLEFEIKVRGLASKVSQIVIPMERVYHIRKGKKVATERNHYPGYILIEMDPIIIGEFKPLFRAVEYSSGFLGSKTKPTPIRQSEVEYMLGKIDDLANDIEIPTDKYFVGETVELIDGPFKTFVGKITDVDEPKMKLKLSVKIFGRETPVEVDYEQVSKDIEN